MIRLRPTLFHVPRLPRRWTTQSNACSAHDHAPDPFAANTSGYAGGLAQDIPLVLAYHFRRRALKGWGETENRAEFDACIDCMAPQGLPCYPDQRIPWSNSSSPHSVKVLQGRIDGW